MSFHQRWFDRKSPRKATSTRLTRPRPHTVRQRLAVTALESRIVPAPVMTSVSNNGPGYEGGQVTIIGVAWAGGPGLFYEFDFEIGRAHV